MRSRGQLIGTILIIAGLVVALACSLWAITARGEESGLRSSGLALALAGAVAGRAGHGRRPPHAGSGLP